ncbi:MAG: glutamate 5-kinase [Gammaproteobacteria bacterium]|nr:glutamate 5-kinase [Gammaproteobacteria bacterium]MDH5213405.1 glutamate 5-kinase [Gammaproteobacteria bacterium]MDH5502322.1 glutamate 5-kinase [Gammaproteobacteria bacterium]
MPANALADFRRIVIKIGSALLLDQERRLLSDWLAGLAEDISILRDSHKQILIVTSGAVAIGSHILNIQPRRSRLEELQAAAAAGQVRLVNAYQEALGRHGIIAAQVLLTPDDTEVRRRFLNARGTLEKLLEHNVVPVINENDTVATDELRYGDNDRLAARVAQLVMADGLVLLSDVDGFYTGNPRIDPQAQHIPLIREITDEMFEMAGTPGSAVGSGGMTTKLQAARIATHAGCTTVIASGAVERPLHALASGGKCSIFVAENTPAAARKQWLAGILEVRGELRLDAGAVAALRDGKSLLPVGMVEVIGNFRRGDAVTLVDASGAELGRGLAAYASDEAVIIRGRQSEEIESILGYRGRAVMVHRDDLVWFGKDDKALKKA